MWNIRYWLGYLMSYDSLLIYRCTVQRSSVTGTNDLGQPIVSWADHLTDVHCRYLPVPYGVVHALERETVFVTDVVSKHLLHVRKIDVKEADRITDITLGGTTIDGGAFDIDLVRFRANSVGGHHLELMMTRVAPAAYEDPTA